MDTSHSDMNEPNQSRNLRPSEVPTIPAPRQSKDSTTRILLAAYRAESARLVRLAAQLKEMGIDPQAAWDGAQ